MLLWTVSKKLANKLTFILVILFYSVGVNAEEDRRANLPVYIELQPAFVVNYLGYSDKLKYLKASITLRASNIEGDTLVEANLPLVRDGLVMYLSSLTVEQVTGALAREESRKQAIAVLNEILKEETGIEPITDVLFTSFVTQ